MTRKDYELITRVIRNAVMPWQVRSDLVANLAWDLKKDNPRFDMDRFVQACEPDVVRAIRKRVT